MNYACIIDGRGKPPMPAKRFRRVRKLLKSGKPVHKDRPRMEIVAPAHWEMPGMRACPRTNNESIESGMADAAGLRLERRRHDKPSRQREARHDGMEIMMQPGRGTSANPAKTPVRERMILSLIKLSRTMKADWSMKCESRKKSGECGKNALK